MSKTYVKTNTEITLEKGKLNFFTTDKRFTEAVDNYANAACKIACINKTVKTSISARRTLIDEKVARASKETYVNKTALDAEVKGLNDEIESIQAIASEKIATINKTKMTIGDVDTNMYYGYKEYKEGTLSKTNTYMLLPNGLLFMALSPILRLLTPLLPTSARKRRREHKSLNQEVSNLQQYTRRGLT